MGDVIVDAFGREARRNCSQAGLGENFLNKNGFLFDVGESAL